MNACVCMYAYGHINTCVCVCVCVQHETQKQNLEAIQQRFSLSLQKLGEDAEQEYTELQEENQFLYEKISEKQGEIQGFNTRAQELKDRLNSNEYQTIKKGNQLRKKKEELEVTRAELQEETEESLSPQELQQKYAQRIKECKQEKEDAEKAYDDVSDALEQLQDTISEREEELKEAKRLSMKEKKLSALYEKAAKIAEYLEAYPRAKKEQKQQLQQLERTIVALMRHVSKGVETSGNIPSKAELSNMQSELSFKEQRMQNSKETLGHLREQVCVYTCVCVSRKRICIEALASLSHTYT
jgi:chromosome segregation ATPase